MDRRTVWLLGSLIFLAAPPARPGQDTRHEHLPAGEQRIALESGSRGEIEAYRGAFTVPEDLKAHDSRRL